MRASAFAGILVTALTALAQGQAIEWKTSEGGNGHWYQAVASGEITWLGAEAAARKHGGHLATMTDAAEDEFVRFVVAEGDQFWVNYYQGPWFGAYQLSENDCDWRWVTGETWGYTNWHPENPDGPCPQGTQLWMPDRLWQDNWKDDATRAVAYLVEWDADCNGDGIVDYGQILDGTFEDLDGNGVPDCCDQGKECNCRADLTEDGQVNTLDFLLYLGAWAQHDPIADWDGNGVVNSLDFLAYLNDWVAGC